ncbi:hypothetical protein SAMN04490248_101147 [Salinihabitans flavidus]|uniref:Uncharacterized protein n=1 Tax=Salinihabitans flavidus TaxID=569882 RepID=A0A1H8LHT0_9RHOB|nr:hypothetical protein [Salinihabitans flavidus]SEO04619.1 hypothetical protein SAMN04490248_101147 [Salinihabitans flavidus]
MEKVDVLYVNETVAVDCEQLAELHRRLGSSGAEDVVMRAMEELALRLTHAERLYREGALTEMPKCARSMAAIAEQVGMLTVAQVARDVTRCLDGADGVALAATVTRLMRIGERSISEIWELQDMTV